MFNGQLLSDMKNRPSQSIESTLVTQGNDAPCFMLQGCMYFLVDGRLSTCCFDPFGQQCLTDNFTVDCVKKFEFAQGRIASGELNSFPICSNCKWVRRQEFISVPKFLKLELVSTCNLGCCYVPSKNIVPTRRAKYMSGVTLKSILNAMSEYKIEECWLHGYGESLLHPSFPWILDKVRNSLQNTVIRLDTNGHFLTDPQAESLCRNNVVLQFAIDGATQAIYEQHRIGGKLSRVLKNLERLLKVRKQAKSATTIVWRYLAYQDNLCEIELASEIAWTMGVDKFVLAIGDSGDISMNVNDGQLSGYESQFVKIEYRNNSRYHSAREKSG